MAEVLIDIPDDIAAAIELLIDNNIEFIKPALLRQVLYVIAGKIPGPSDGSFTAVAPLNYDPFTNQFIISQAGTATDGYLSKEDYVRFGLSNKIMSTDFPRLTADQQDFEIPMGKTAFLASVNGSFFYPLKENNTDEIETFSQTDNVVSFRETLVIGNYPVIFYQ